MLLEELHVECDRYSRLPVRQRAANVPEVHDNLVFCVLLVVWCRNSPPRFRTRGPGNTRMSKQSPVSTASTRNGETKLIGFQQIKRMGASPRHAVMLRAAACSHAAA